MFVNSLWQFEEANTFTNSRSVKQLLTQLTKTSNHLSHWIILSIVKDDSEVLASCQYFPHDRADSCIVPVQLESRSYSRNFCLTGQNHTMNTCQSRLLPSVEVWSPCNWCWKAFLTKEKSMSTCQTKEI